MREYTPVILQRPRRERQRGTSKSRGRTQSARSTNQTSQRPTEVTTDPHVTCAPYCTTCPRSCPFAHASVKLERGIQVVHELERGEEGDGAGDEAEASGAE